MNDGRVSAPAAARRNTAILLPAWLAVAGLLGTGVAGLSWWSDPPHVAAANTAGIITLVHAATVTALVVAVMIIPLLLRPGLLPWLLSGLLFFGAVSQIFGWQAARTTTFGLVACVVAALCAIAAVTSLFAAQGRSARDNAR